MGSTQSIGQQRWVQGLGDPDQIAINTNPLMAIQLGSPSPQVDQVQPKSVMGFNPNLKKYTNN